MSDASELFAKIENLSKRYKLTATETFALQTEAGAVCFLIDASDDDLVQFEAFTAPTPSNAAWAHVAMIMRGAVADLKLRGVDRSNAKEYFEAKLAELERKYRAFPLSLN